MKQYMWRFKVKWTDFPKFHLNCIDCHFFLAYLFTEEYQSSISQTKCLKGLLEILGTPTVKTFEKEWRLVLVLDFVMYVSKLIVSAGRGDQRVNNRHYSEKIKFAVPYDPITKH